MQITVAKDENVHEAVVRWLECDDADDLRYVQLGDVTVGDDESFEDAGVEDGARLGVCIEEMTVDEALERLAAMGATDVPDNIACTATQVCFQYMDFETLPREIFKLRDLDRLMLRHCTCLTSLPPEIAQLTNLHILSMTGCTGLETLPQEMAQLANLRKLNLTGCTHLETLPREMALLTNLRELNLMGCTGLTSLPQEMAQLANLRVLNLRGCTGLETLPDLSGLRLIDTMELTRESSAAAVAWWEGGFKAIHQECTP